MSGQVTSSYFDEGREKECLLTSYSSNQRNNEWKIEIVDVDTFSKVSMSAKFVRRRDAV